jgi:hypothetical protein
MFQQLHREINVYKGKMFEREKIMPENKYGRIKCNFNAKIFSTSGFSTPPRPPEYGFEFAKKIDYEIADFRDSGVNDTARASRI